MISTAAARRRWGVRDDDEGPYVSLPYGNPYPGEYFGPAMIGGPPGSSTKKRSFRSHNAYTSEIVLRLQQRFQKDFENNETSKSTDVNLNNRYANTMYSKTLEQKVISSNPDFRTYSVDIINNTNGSNVLDQSSDANNHQMIAHSKNNLSLVNGCASLNPNITDCIGKLSRHSSMHDISNVTTGSVSNNDVFQRERGFPDWKSFDQTLDDGDILNHSSGAVSVNAIFVKDMGNNESDIRDKDIPFVTNASEIIEMPKFKDYESMELNDQTVLAVPPSHSQCQNDKPPIRSFNQITNLNEEQCREALVQFASSKCCYGQKPALEHEIIEIKPSTTLHYILETFCERRSIDVACEPYTGETLQSSAGTEQPPQPWAIHCDPDNQFHQHTKHIQIPNTATVKVCDKCGGNGKAQCLFCCGSGGTTCKKCEGQGQLPHYLPSSGTTKMLPCSICNGVRKTSCGTCEGNGHQKCTVCNGHGKLKCYLKLNVRYMTHHDDFVMEDMELPGALHDKVSGILIYQEELPEVWPLSDYPVNDVVDHSEALIERHKRKCANTRHILQRQSIWAIPVTEVIAQWKGSWKSQYWIYGKDRKVYCPDYPHKCCGCFGAMTCSIL